MFKDIYKLAMGILLVVAGIMTIVGAVQLLNIGLDQLLGVQNCVGRIAEGCVKDTNGVKRDLAQALATVLIAKPVAVLAYFKIK